MKPFHCFTLVNSNGTAIFWVGPVLLGKTKCGTATVRVLNINADDRVRLRAILIKAGRFHPSESNH